MSWLTQKRRTVARLLLLWLAFGGQLFCTSHAGFGVESVSDVAQQPVKTCCHGGKTATPEPQLKPFCCESPASFCCGDAKLGSGDTDSHFSKLPTAIVSAPDNLAVAPLYSPLAVPQWLEDFHLRRTSPPLHLLNCVFLD
ncbi:MAG: hypothetical protein OIF34_01260 [Porticoccaceae bacterium]|nr:hypothetical protein [Porticoccaceae bacterium]